jgi:hypothetical protein
MPTKYQEYEQAVLDMMWSECQLHPDDEDEYVWIGGLTRRIHDLFPIGVNAGSILKALKDSGAIQELSRGGGQTPSVYWLRRRNLAVDDDGQPIEVKAHPYSVSKQEAEAQSYAGLNYRLHNLEKFLPMLLEIATERSGAPSPAEQIAAAFDEAASGSIKDQLQALLPEENSTQEDT